MVNKDQKHDTTSGQDPSKQFIMTWQLLLILTQYHNIDDVMCPSIIASNRNVNSDKKESARSDHAEWKPRYAPSPEQEEIDRCQAYETGVPHGKHLCHRNELLVLSSSDVRPLMPRVPTGFVPRGDAYKGLPTIPLLVRSELVSACVIHQAAVSNCFFP